MRTTPLLLGAALAVASCSLPPRTSELAVPRSGAAPVREGSDLTADQQVAHVLNRLAFGPRPGDIARVRAVGVERWIEQQLRPERIDDRSVERILAHFTTLDAKPRENVAAFRELRVARRRQQMQTGDSVGGQEARRAAMAADPDLRASRRQLQRAVVDVQAAKIARAVLSERQLYETMVDFWSNHFSVFVGKGQTRLFVGHYDREVIRPNALGKFRDLLGAVAKSPAMLVYLDNWQSVADSGRATGRATGFVPRRRRGINENYARELLELHTLGVDGGYTQRDVGEVARALTGWTVDQRAGAFVFRPAVHDAEEKVVLGVRLAAGRGIEDGEDVLDIVARHPATARHIAKKLAMRFVSDSPPPALVARAAAVFQRTDGDIREVLRTLFTSSEFFDRTAYRSKVKSPFELVASALRAMNAVADTTPRTAQLVARLGQPIYGRQTPDGWPEQSGEWLNTGAILNRINFGLGLAGGRVPGVSLDRWPHTKSLLESSREAQVNGVIRALLNGEASSETWSILRSGDNPLAAVADTSPVSDMGVDSTSMIVSPRPGRGMARRSRALDRPVALEGLAQVVGLAIGAPEFQRK